MHFIGFSAAYEQAGMAISTKEVDVLCLSRNPRGYTLHVSSNILQQRPVTRGGESPLEKFSPPWKNVLDTV